MVTETTSFRSWLSDQIREVLSRKLPQPPFLVWCDPERVWRELLIETATTSGFEIWAVDEPEIRVRHRFQGTPRSARVVWLPVARDQITYFKVFEVQASEVKQLSLTEALSHYGVELPSERWAELKPLLPAHVKRVARPATVRLERADSGHAKETLISDQRVLEILAAPGTSFDDLCRREPPSHLRATDRGRFRPSPAQAETIPTAGGSRALATLLCTEAAHERS